MSKICVKSRVTNNLVFIPVHLIESVFVNSAGHTLIRRTGKETIRVYESVDEIQRKVDLAYGAAKPPQVVVKETVRHVDRPVVIAPRSQGYRPATRTDSIVDTVLGIGGGVIIGGLIGDAIGGVFD